LGATASSTLAAANVAYTLVDTSTFSPRDLSPKNFRRHIAEDRGQCVGSIPARKAHSHPLAKVEEVIPIFSRSASLHPGGVASMAMTWKSSECGQEQMSTATRTAGSLIFFAALRRIPPGEGVHPAISAAHAPLGRADLLLLLIPEMMEWVLPTRVRQRYHAVLRNSAPRPEVLAFLAAAPGAVFFSASTRNQTCSTKSAARFCSYRCRSSRPVGTKAAQDLLKPPRSAATGTGNDAFGTHIRWIYAPHLRTDPGGANLIAPIPSPTSHPRRAHGPCRAARLRRGWRRRIAFHRS